MTFYPKFKNKSIVKYCLLTDNFNLSKFNKGIYTNIEPKYVQDTGCPSVSSLKNRMFTVYSPFNVDIKILNNEYSYQFDTDKHPDNRYMHSLLKASINLDINKKDIQHLQLLTPYAFVTDDPSIEIITIEPNIKTKNLNYVSASIKPYGWIRTLNSAYVVKNKDKESLVSFNTKSPMFNILFNKPVSLEYIEPTQKIYDYYTNCKDIVNYTNQITKHYKSIVTRRPKKLL